MKWIAVALFFAIGVALTVWLRGKPRQAPVVWGLLSFLPFVISPWRLIVSPFSTPTWSGYVKGWDFSLIDAVAIAIIFGTRGKWPRIYLIAPLLIYVFVVLFGITQAKFGNLAASYFVQITRVFLVFLAAARIASTEKGQEALLTGAILGIAVQAVYAIIAFAGGALQTGGSLGHQNLLGFVSHFAVIPAFAALLSGKWPKRAMLGVVAGLIAVSLTASRATIAFSGLGLATTLFLCLALRFNSRKAMVAMMSVVLILVTAPLTWSMLERRFQAQGTSFFEQDKERQAFEKAAWAMINDNPLGVGPNHYVFIANTEGYSANAGVIWSQGSRSTNVHNSFLLIFAETGYPGIIAVIGLFLSALYYAFSSAIRFRRYAGSELFIGLGCALISILLHSYYEWMLVVFPSQYLLAATLGLISGLRAYYVNKTKSAHQNGRASAASRHAPPFRSSHEAPLVA